MCCTCRNRFCAKMFGRKNCSGTQGAFWCRNASLIFRHIIIEKTLVQNIERDHFVNTYRVMKNCLCENEMRNIGCNIDFKTRQT